MSEETAKLMTIAELKEAKLADLRVQLHSALDDLHKMKFKHQTNQLKQTHKLRALRQHIARLNTVITARSLVGDST